MKPVFNAPRYMLLKLRYDGALSSFAFKFNSRCYIKEMLRFRTRVQAGAYSRPLLSST